MRIVNLGCGKLPIKNMVNVDLEADASKGIIDVDLDDYSWNIVRAFKDHGIEEHSVDAFLGVHFLEHITNPLQLMNALYLLTKPMGFVEFHVPYGSSDDADEDPTHARRYFTDSWKYFTPTIYRRADYGLEANWQLRKLHLNLQAGVDADPGTIEPRLRHERNIVQEMRVLLQACPMNMILSPPPVELHPHDQHRTGMLLADVMAPASPGQSSL